MIILDTDTLTIVQRRSGDAYDRLAGRLDATGDHPVCVTIVSYEEQMRGWLSYIGRFRLPQKQVTAYARLQAMLDDFRTRPVVEFDEAAAAECQHLFDSRIRIGTMDLKIAAIARVHDALLVSRNLGDFEKVPGLRVEDWTR